MKKLLSLLLSVVMLATMLYTLDVTASAAVTPPEISQGIVTVISVEELDYVYDHLDEYITNGLVYIVITSEYGATEPNILTKNYDFRNVPVSLYFTEITKNASVTSTAQVVIQRCNILGTVAGGVVCWRTDINENNNNINNGKIICTGMDSTDYDFILIGVQDFSKDVDFINNGTIIMKNSGVFSIQKYYSKVNNVINSDTGVIINKYGEYSACAYAGFTKNITGYVLTGEKGETSATFINHGSVTKFPIDISSPDTTGGTDLTMSGVAIPEPTYTVTIPTTIDFGTCDKAMANDTAKNRIKEITVDGLTITHSNLFVNEKQITIAMGSDFTIKNGANTLNFDLYDGTTKLATNGILITANPTAIDTAVNDKKTLTAKLDKTQIKASGIYTGTVTFTVAMSDSE